MKPHIGAIVIYTVEGRKLPAIVIKHSDENCLLYILDPAEKVPYYKAAFAGEWEWPEKEQPIDPLFSGRTKLYDAPVSLEREQPIGIWAGESQECKAQLEEITEVVKKPAKKKGHK
jgi:hypothetical protein